MGQFGKNILYAILIFLVLTALYASFAERDKPEAVSLSRLVEEIRVGEILRISAANNKLEIVLKNGTVQTSQKEPDAALSDTLSNYGVTPEMLADITIEVKEQSGLAFWLSALLPFLLPIILIGLFIWLTMRQVQRSNGQALMFGQSRARVINPDDPREKVTFKDVAGAEEAKEELLEIVDFLKNPQKFLDIGARIPRGVLLMGAPGTGKTLLAKAVAFEAGVPFFHMSASEFVEMFVGVGASVTGDTPVLIREDSKVQLLSIREVADKFYKEGEGGMVKKVSGLETLSARRAGTGFWGFKNNEDKFNMGGSRFAPFSGVYRHKVDSIYEIYFRGGVVRTTGDHSIFVREKNYVRAKRADELEEGDVLVNLPYKVRSSFVPGFGTTHKVKAHEFDVEQIPLLPIWEEQYRQANEKYAYALAHAETMTQKEIGTHVGMSQAIVGKWIDGTHKPRVYSSRSITQGLPAQVAVTKDLMRILGYYMAEGRTTAYYTQFVFGSHEKALINDCISLVKQIFNLPVHVEETTTNSTRITVHAEPLARFFETQCGTGSHQKHLPQWIWELPWEYVCEFVKGYSDGDGYVTKDGKLSMTSVSHGLIRELTWLLNMHGIQVGVRRMALKPGRIISMGKKPLPAGEAWNIIVGKTSDFWSGLSYRSPNQFKRPIVQKVTKKPYNDYVYDLVGCENEAFFGGEKPMLLHNSRVRDLFKMAKKAAPAIIFVDEIDAVGRHRGAGLGGGHDEREQTLNQILTEMDGFETSDKVIIMAATNRPDVLDPALLRPGRFDRRVVLNLPDIAERDEILQVHAAKKTMSKDVTLRQIAERTPGFSGADLANLVNEAAILAARHDRKTVSQEDLVVSIEKVMLGPERKSKVFSEKEKKITAFHEAGHALVAASLPNADPVHKISIVSRGRAGGYTMKLPTEDRHLYTRDFFLDELAVSLGGYAAEEVVFGEITTGSSDDIRKATGLARGLVTRYGMSEKVGPVAWDDQSDLVFLGREIGHEKKYSEEIASLVDTEVARFMKEALEKAKGIVRDRKEKLMEIAEYLIKHETMEQNTFRKLMGIAGGEPASEPTAA